MFSRLFKKKEREQKPIPDYIQAYETMFRDASQWDFSEYKYGVPRMKDTELYAATSWNTKIPHIGIRYNAFWTDFDWEYSWIQAQRTGNSKTILPIPMEYRKYLWKIFRQTHLDFLNKQAYTYQTKVEQETIPLLKEKGCI